jgi:hypothetical protein
MNIYVCVYRRFAQPWVTFQIIDNFLRLLLQMDFSMYIITLLHNILYKKLIKCLNMCYSQKPWRKLFPLLRSLDWWKFRWYKSIKCLKTNMVIYMITEQIEDFEKLVDNVMKARSNYKVLYILCNRSANQCTFWCNNILRILLCTHRTLMHWLPTPQMNSWTLLWGTTVISILALLITISNRPCISQHNNERSRITANIR